MVIVENGLLCADSISKIIRAFTVVAVAVGVV